MTQSPHSQIYARGRGPLPDSSHDDLTETEGPADLAARPTRRGFREKLSASLRGLKHAFRSDSSFFAHVYRFMLIAMTASLLGVGALEWCFLVIAFALVLMAEMANCAIDTLARALGDPEEAGLRMAREIATGGVLIAVTTSAGLSILVLTLKLGVLLGWWG